MAIENKNLKAGALLVGRYKGKTTVCLVEAGEEGSVVYRIDGKDKTFKSLRSAATEIAKGPINGWKFWSLESEETAKPDKTTKAPAKKTGDNKGGPSHQAHEAATDLPGHPRTREPGRPAAGRGALGLRRLH